ncbi:hypothetical protein ACH4Y0_02435 [Streptomyces sp. NPDC020707]
MFDEDSTEQLRRDPHNTRYTIPKDQERYRVPRIPAACIKLTDTPADS